MLCVSRSINFLLKHLPEFPRDVAETNPRKILPLFARDIRSHGATVRIAALITSIVLSVEVIAIWCVFPNFWESFAVTSQRGGKAAHVVVVVCDALKDCTRRLLFPNVWRRSNASVIVTFHRFPRFNKLCRPPRGFRPGHYLC